MPALHRWTIWKPLHIFSISLVPVCHAAVFHVFGSWMCWWNESHISCRTDSLSELGQLGRIFCHLRNNMIHHIMTFSTLFHLLCRMVMYYVLTWGFFWEHQTCCWHTTKRNKQNVYYKIKYLKKQEQISKLTKHIPCFLKWHLKSKDLWITLLHFEQCQWVLLPLCRSGR